MDPFAVSTKSNIGKLKFELMKNNFLYISQMNNSIDNCFSHLQIESDDDVTQFIETGPISFTHKLETGSKVTQSFIELDQYIQDWTAKIIQLGLSQKQSNEIFKLYWCLLEKVNEQNVELSSELTKLSLGEVMSLSTEFVKEKLLSYSTTFRYKKTVAENELFVPPVEKALGTHIEMKRCKENKIAVPRVIQSKMQYISICDTIRSLFLRDDFLEAFLESNEKKDHQCTEGVYVDFCCGSTYKKNELYRENRYCVQIQIATDDFEVCNPLQSKAGIYKICPIYFTIRNLPSKYLSRLDNIYLAAVCYASDLKTDQCDFNNIWKFIYDDIKILESNGVDVFIPSMKMSINVKGSISFCTYDNLGAHISLGFAEGFKCPYNCRFCENSSDEYQNFFNEKQCRLRTKESYSSNLKVIQTLTKIDYKQTFGVKRYCQLNDLKFYHMLENKSVDIMHDLNEGVIPKLLKNIFEYFFAEGLVTENELNSRIKSFDYGISQQRNVPNSVFLKKKNLGQNATQSRCLLFHLPFLLANFRNDIRVKHVWILVESLLRIMQTFYSRKVNEEQLVALEIAVSTFLSKFREKFEDTITIKMHLLLHYPNIIREMGPIVHMSSMRLESKHKSLKELLSSSFNHQNIPFSIATKHQEQLAHKKNTYIDELTTGKKTIMTECDLQNYDFLQAFKDTKCCKTLWVEYNGFRYNENVMIVSEKYLLEIREILLINDRVHFVCIVYEAQYFDDFFNSFKIQCSNNSLFKLIDFESLENKKPYEKKQIKNDLYILDETLDLKEFFKNIL